MSQHMARFPIFDVTRLMRIGHLQWCELSMSALVDLTLCRQ